MSGLGGWNPSPESVVIGLVQLQLPVVDDTSVIQPYYRKLHPWVPVEPWEDETWITDGTGCGFPEPRWTYDPDDLLPGKA
jgi:hypothetical protein